MKWNVRFLLVFIFISITYLIDIQAQTTFYVDGDKGNNSYSGRGGWKNAKKDLQNAIDAAGEGDRIWVKEGIYFPTAIPDSAINLKKGLTYRDRCFHIPKYLEIFGGFEGNETELSQRNWEEHPTILSGDFGVTGTQDDNAYHVIIISGVRNARLDGFTVVDGYADGDNPVPLKVKGIIQGFVKYYDVYDDKGGGVYIVNSPTELENFSVKDCASDDKGGGMFVTQSVSTLKNVNILNNESEDAEGGGIYFERTKNTLNQCVIASNRAYQGGGIFTLADTLTMYNSLILNNIADAAGGAIYTSVGTVVKLEGLTVWGNNVGFSGKGGGIYGTQSNMDIKNCVIQQNAINAITTSKGADIDTLFLSGKLNINYTFAQQTWPGNANAVTAVAFSNTENAIGPDNVWKTGDDGFIPKANSSVIAQGIFTGNLQDDITGLLRGNSIDIGAYQYNECTVYSKILYVNAANNSPNQDGSSWQKAFSNLQDAFDIINNGCGSRVKEIWVAKGTYIPEKYFASTTLTEADKSFFLLKDVKLFGGFDGTENNLGERDFKKNKTILSGKQNDSTSSHHVFITSGLGVNAFISGFYIESGNAASSSSRINGSRTFDNFNGGGLYCDSSFAYFSDIFISKNKAGKGAGIFVNEGKPVWKNIEVNHNQALSAGGAIYLLNTNAGFSDLIVDSNTADLGAGIATYNCGFATFNKIILKNNKAIRDGGAYYGYNGTVRISGALFYRNEAGNGGGIFNNIQKLFAENIVFLENRAFSGGATYEVNGFPEYTNCNFIRNAADSLAGASYAMQFGAAQWVNNIFFENKLKGDVSNPAADVFIENNVNKNLQNNLFQTLKNGSGNITGSPQFFNTNNFTGSDGVWFTEDDGMMLLKSSPCLGAGNSAIRPGQDITGRPLRSIVDMGAYMGYCGTGGDSILYVDAASTNDNMDGRSWQTAYNDLQMALNATFFDCSEIKEIWVKEGTYYPSVIPDSLYNEQKGIAMSPRFRTYFFKKDIKIYGGFEGTEKQLSERQPAFFPSILSGDIGVENDTSDNVYHILTLKGQIAGYSVLDGFTLTAANANRIGKHYLSDTTALVVDSCGAAIHAFFSGITVRNCVFKQNYAISGAAIFSARNTINIENTVFENNVAEHGAAIFLNNDNIYIFSKLTFSNNQAKLGGAIYAEGSRYELDNVVFENNLANEGGAVYHNLSYPVTMNNVIFRKNKAIKGGAIYDLNSKTYVRNGLFLQNEASDSAGVFYVNRSDLFLYNAALYANKAGKFAGGIFQQESQFATNLGVYNSIFFQNESNSNVNASDADISSQPGKLFVTHSFSNTFTCDTCFSGDPAFRSVNQAEGEDGIFFTPDDGFALQFSSQLINKAQWATTPAKDICGYAKNIHFSDIGPYKSSPCITHHYTERIYVNASQNILPADGKSWATAYTDLQQALDVANAACVNIKEIWIAKGVYTPTQYPDSLYNALKNNLKSAAQKSFFLSGKIAIYGGFEGFETDISQRNLQANSTALHGWYNGLADTSQKCGNIFLISNAGKVVVDGVNLKFAAPSFTSLSFNNETFSNSSGGGFNIIKSDVNISNATFSTIHSGVGGAIYSRQSKLKLQHNVFSNNEATLRGAAMALDSSTLISENNFFLKNSVTDRSLGFGGAIQLRSSEMSSSMDVWEENFAESAGAIGINTRSIAHIRNAVFHKNSAFFTGGAISQISGAKFILENILFARNNAREGGAIYLEDSLQGNGITFLANTSGDVGGAIMVASGAQHQLNLQNALFAFNDCPGNGKDFYRPVGNSFDIQHCMLQEVYSGAGNFVGINEFRDTTNLIGPDQIWMTHDDGANLSIGSEALNKGNAFAPEKDIAGYSRKAISDVGAYEFSVCNDYEEATQLYVNVNNTSTVQDGLSWNTAFTKLQDAINITQLNCVSIKDIWVAKGIYFPEYIPDEAANTAAGNAFNERRKTYWNKTPGLKLWGGFQAGDSLLSQRNPTENQVWIDGDIGLKDDMSDNSIHLFALVNIADTTYIDGISFRNANANTGSNFIINGKVVPDNGAAIMVQNAAIQLTASEISENNANEAAAIFSQNANIQLNKVILKNNKAEQGGALALHQSSFFAENAEFNNNFARNFGGAIFNTDNSSMSLQQCSFKANKAVRGGSIDNSKQTNLSIFNTGFSLDSAQNGAAINLEENTNLVAENCSFNQTYNANGAVRSNGATLKLDRNTFSNNSSFENGAALNVFGDSYIELKNSTFNANSTIGKGGAIYLDNPKENSLIENCNFNDNSAQESGGALKITTRSYYFTFKDNVFQDNRSVKGGGAVLIENAALNFVRCRFDNNIADFGGAVYALNANNWNTFDTCIFTANSAKQAGGAYYSPSRFNTQLLNSNFENNAAANGGVYYAYNNASFNIINSIFYQNIAKENGACFYHPAKSELRLYNSLLLENNAQKGGVCYSESNAKNTIVNSTFYKNNAAGSGGALYAETGVANSIFNNIFRSNSIDGDTTSVFRNFNGFTSGVNYNMLDTSFLLSYLSNYPETDPDFLDENNYKGNDGIWRTADDGLVPQAFSFVKGKGVLSFNFLQALSYDLLNVQRNNVFDLGAYKSESLGTNIQSKTLENLHVYPNPFSAVIQVKTETPLTKKGYLQLIDASGRICFSQMIQPIGNTFSLTLPGNLSSGTYFLSIQSGNLQYFATLLKL